MIQERIGRGELTPTLVPERNLVVLNRYHYVALTWWTLCFNIEGKRSSEIDNREKKDDRNYFFQWDISPSEQFLDSRLQRPVVGLSSSPGISYWVYFDLGRVLVCVNVLLEKTKLEVYSTTGTGCGTNLETFSGTSSPWYLWHSCIYTKFGNANNASISLSDVNGVYLPLVFYSLTIMTTDGIYDLSLIVH